MAKCEWSVANGEELKIITQKMNFNCQKEKVQRNMAPNTILAINIRTALNCHNLLDFNRSGMIYFSKFTSSKNLSNEIKLVPVSLFV